MPWVDVEMKAGTPPPGCDLAEGCQVTPGGTHPSFPGFIQSRLSLQGLPVDLNGFHGNGFGSATAWLQSGGKYTMRTGLDIQSPLKVGSTDVREITCEMGDAERMQ